MEKEDVYLKEFDVETWMTNHEQKCQYNLADTWVSDMSIHELESLIHKDLMSDLMHMRMDYGPITGSDCLKDAILSLYKTGTRDNIAVAHGAINANEHVMDTLLNKGDHVIALTPSYEQFYSYPASIGCEYDLVELDEDNNWEPVIDDFKKFIKPETKMFILNSPNNPTGTVIKQSLMEELIELARSHSIYILVDEIYRGMNNTLCDSISDMYELGIATASLSKVYSFAGLRLGWIKGPKQLIDEINFRRDYTIISTGPWNDYLATVVLQHKDLILDRSRHIILGIKKILKEWHEKEDLVECVIPEDGTVCFLHYLFDMPSKELCEKLQNDTGVFFVPGMAFNKEYHLRFGFTSDSKVIKEGLETFSSWIHSHITEAE